MRPDVVGLALAVLVALVLVLVLVVALVVVGRLLWAADRATDAAAAAREARLVRALDDAQARLVLAWKEGYSVPPPALDAPEPTPPLPEVVEEWIDQWEGPEAQEAYRRIAREYQAAGRQPPAILHALEQRLGRDA